MRRAALLVGALTVLGALGACGGETTTTTTPQPTRADRATATTTAPSAATESATESAPVPGDTAASASASARTDGRCRTDQLSARVGRLDPGAGQRNFPVVLTNTSDRTCTLYGYPGAAFVDASGSSWALTPSGPRRPPGRSG